MKVNNIMMKAFISSKRVLWGILLIYIIFLFFVASRHEFWSDEWHVWFMCKNLSITKLIKSMAHEGHFCLWHLLILPFAKSGCGFWSLELVSCVLCCLAAWIILFKAPFRPIYRLVLVASYPMLYAFPILPRCYALIPPIIFAIATFYRKLPNYKYLYCFFVGLLAHTHSYMEGTVGMLFLLYCYEYLYLPYKIGNREWKKNIKPALLTIIIILLAAVQVIGSKDHIDSSFKDSNTELLNRFYNAYALHPVDSLSDISNIIIPNIDLPLSILLWSIIFVALYKCFWKERQSRRYAIVAFFSIGFMLIFGTTIFMMALQRVLLPFFIIIFLLWINYRKDIEKYTNIAIIALCISVSLSQYSKIADDINRIYCNGEKVADFIHRNVPYGSILAMNHQYYYIHELLEEDYKRCLLEPQDNTYTDDMIDEFLEKNPCDVFYAITKKRELKYIGCKYQLSCIYNGKDDNTINIWHSVYKIKRSE